MKYNFKGLMYFFKFFFKDDYSYIRMLRDEMIDSLKHNYIEVEVYEENNSIIKMHTLSNYVLLFYYPDSREMELMFDIRTTPEMVAFITDKLRKIRSYSINKISIRQSFYPKKQSENERKILYRGSEAYKQFVEDISEATLNAHFNEYIREMSILYNYTVSENIQ